MEVTRSVWAKAGAAMAAGARPASTLDTSIFIDRAEAPKREAVESGGENDDGRRIELESDCMFRFEINFDVPGPVKPSTVAIIVATRARTYANRDMIWLCVHSNELDAQDLSFNTTSRKSHSDHTVWQRANRSFHVRSALKECH